MLFRSDLEYDEDVEDVGDAPTKGNVSDEAELPTKERAEKCIEFAQTLADFLFVLPARVKRGVRAAKRG